MKVAQFVNNFSKGDGMSHLAVDIAERLDDCEILYRKNKREIPDTDVTCRKIGILDILKLRSRYDVVHTHFGLSILLARLFDAKHVHTFHGTPPCDRGSKVEKFNRLAFRFGGIDKFVSVSKDAQSTLKNLYGETSDVIYNGVDLEHFKSLGIVPSEKKVGCVTKDKDVKNPTLVVVNRDKIDGKVIVVGEGFEVLDCMKEFYNAIEVLAIPSKYESFCLPAVEALACGTPVVCFDVGALSEIMVDGETGYLVQSEDEFIDRINQALREGADSFNCRERILDFDIEHTVGKYIRLYKEVRNDG